MITAERKAELVAQGYYVEDMGETYGEDFVGQFRYMHNIDPDIFQDCETSDSENDAWIAANSFDHYQKRAGR